MEAEAVAPQKHKSKSRPRLKSSYQQSSTPKTTLPHHLPLRGQRLQGWTDASAEPAPGVFGTVLVSHQSTAGHGSSGDIGEASGGGGTGRGH